MSFFFFNDTATTEIYTLSLHDALPISGERARDRADRHEVDDADPRGVLGAGSGVRASRDRPGHPEDGRPDRIPPADPRERSVRHDRREGVRAPESPGGTRLDFPQTLGTFVRPRDHAVLRRILRTQVDGPRRHSKAHGPEGGRALHGTKRDDARGRFGARDVSPGTAPGGGSVPPGGVPRGRCERVTPSNQSGLPRGWVPASGGG